MNIEERAESARRGLRLAKARGIRIGRPPRPDRAEMVRLKRGGATFRKIAAELGCSTATVARALAEAKK